MKGEEGGDEVSGKRLGRSQLLVDTVAGRGRAKKQDPIVDGGHLVLRLSDDAEPRAQREAALAAWKAPEKSEPGKQIQGMRKRPKGWAVGACGAIFPSLESS